MATLNKMRQEQKGHNFKIGYESGRERGAGNINSQLSHKSSNLNSLQQAASNNLGVKKAPTLGN